MRRHILMFLPLVMAILGMAQKFLGQGSYYLSLGFVGFGFLMLFYKETFPPWRQLILSALISLIGALATFFFANQGKLGPLVASGLVGVLGARLFKDDDQLTLYVGAFIGMSSVLRLPNLALLVVAGLLGGVFREFFDQAWVGVGGRLGTMAATAILVLLLMGGGGW